MSYNPFSKQISSLEYGDILSLKDNSISEGWFIEYKSNIPKIKGGKPDNLKIAKSISSFAKYKRWLDILGNKL